MAKVIVSYFKIQEVEEKTPLYYFESFAKELMAQGNEVFLLNTAYYNQYNSNTVEDKDINDYLLSKAITFEPDLIIAFNNRIPLSILEYFSVPIIMWDGDAPKYISDIDYIKKNRDRYYIFTTSKDWIQDYIDFGINSKRIYFMPHATSIRSIDIPQTMNISYLGQRAYVDQTLPDMLANYNYLSKCKDILLERFKTGNTDSRFYFEKYNGSFPEDWDDSYLFPMFEERWLTLSQLLDLDLTICGLKSRWEDVKEFMPQLLACYQPRRVWTLKENEVFYNQSKISISPIHPQARMKAFPWRAFDVMASNACLVIGESNDFRALIDGEVDIPIFSSPYDARDICKKLLSDVSLRNEIVKKSNDWVDKNARWILRFKDAEQITGIRLCNGKSSDIHDLTIDVSNIGYSLSTSALRTKTAPSLDNEPSTNERVFKSIHTRLSINKTFSSLLISLRSSILIILVSAVILLLRQYVSSSLLATLLKYLEMIILIIGICMVVTILIQLFYRFYIRVIKH